MIPSVRRFNPSGNVLVVSDATVAIVFVNLLCSNRIDLPRDLPRFDVAQKLVSSMSQSLRLRPEKPS